MTRFSPKIEIINHFDNLINNVDIDIDSCLENYNDQQLLRELPLNEIKDRSLLSYLNNLQVGFYETYESSKKQYQPIDSWPKTTKVVDYLKQTRMTTIEKLRKAEEDALECYKFNSSQFKSEINQEKNIDELRSELFAEKFYFQVHFTQTKQRLLAFKILTFVTDFYISPSDIDTLEKLINHEPEPFCRDAVFDEKTILIVLLYKFFFENLCNNIIPNNIIHVCKQDVLNIQRLYIQYGFSRVNLTGSSIDLTKIADLSLTEPYKSNRIDTIEINIDGLTSLKSLYLGIYLDKIQFATNFWSGYQSQNIQFLHLNGKFSYFNLDNFVNLKRLYLIGTIDENFNFELFKNLCNQLESLRIRFTDIDFKTLCKLFDGCHFPHLTFLSFSQCFIERVDKNFINRFPMLKSLYINLCRLETIEDEAFLNLKQLDFVCLIGNEVRFIGKNAFSKNIQAIDLTNNGLTHIDREFIGLENSAKICLENIYY